MLPWGQRTDWPSLQAIGRRADELGYDSLWTWDHLYPIQGDWRGPIFEGYMILAGWAAVTSHATLGLMVGANTFRNPALTVKLATTLDHMSDGRAVLGIGGAWFEREHEAFGIEFGSGFGERLDWLDEAVALMRGMLTERVGDRARPALPRDEPSATTRRRSRRDCRSSSAVTARRKTLATVARYADAWNTGGDIDFVRHKDEVLRRWCDEVGRDEAEIERTLGLGLVIIRDDPADARRMDAVFREHHPGYSDPPKMRHGRADRRIAGRRTSKLGFRHIFFDAPAPFDDETARAGSSARSSRSSRQAAIPAAATMTGA